MALVKLGPWGDEGTVEWCFKVNKNSWIKQIRIDHGTVMDGIICTIDDGTGNDKTFQFGNPSSGPNVYKIDIEGPEEHLKSIGGAAGIWPNGGTRHLCSLTFYTNKRTLGPYGNTKDDGPAQLTDVQTFSVPIEFASLAGLFGIIGTQGYISSIGFYAKLIN